MSKNIEKLTETNTPIDRDYMLMAIIKKVNEMIEKLNEKES